MRKVLYVAGIASLVAAISVFAFNSTSAAPTTLAPNDVVIVTANSDNSYLANACVNNPSSNALDLLLRRDIGSGTVIKVTDNPWSGTAFGTGEGLLTFTAPTDLPAGTIIHYDDCVEQTGGSGWVRTGSYDPATASGDNLLVYQGANTSPSFIYGFAFRTANWITTGTTTSANSRIPAALSSASPVAYVTGTTARNYQYTTSGNYGIYSADFLNHLRTMSNWSQTGGAATGTQFTQTTVPFDATRPEFNDATRQSPTNEVTNATSVTFRITTSEAVQALAANAFNITTTGTLAYTGVVTASVNGTTYDVTVSGITGNGTVALNSFTGASLLDLRGNPANDITFASESYTIDTVPLTGTVERRTGQAIYTQANSAWFTLTLSKDITDSTLTASDIALGTTTGTVTALNKISETMYEFEVTGMTSGDTVTTTLPIGAVSDLAGNTNQAVITSAANWVMYDATAPSPFVINLDVTSAGHSLDAPLISWNATDSQSGIDYYTISLDGGSFVTATSPYAATLGATGAHTIVVRAYDRAGNMRESTATYPSVVTITAPTVLSSGPITNTTIEITGPSGMNITTVSISGAGSSGFVCTPTPGPTTEAPISCTGGQITASGTLTVVATTDTGVSSQSTQNYVIDTVVPTTTIARSAGQASATNVDSAAFTIVFSKPMNASTVSATDITLSGTTGTVTTLTQIDTQTWEAIVTGMTSGDVAVVTVAAGAATDLAGNSNTASTGVASVRYDTTPPVVTVATLLANTSNVQLTGTVNDPLATLVVTLNGTTYPATNNSDGTWSLTVSPVADGIYNVQINATDEAGNIGTDATTNELTVDTTPPNGTVVTVAPSTAPSPALSGTVDDATAEVTVVVNGVSYPAVNNGDGTWSLAAGTITPALTVGAHTVTVTFEDTAGNAFSTQTSITVLGITTTDGGTTPSTGNGNPAAGTPNTGYKVLGLELSITTFVISCIALFVTAGALVMVIVGKKRRQSRR